MELVQSWQAHELVVYSLACDDNRLFSSSSEGEIKEWDPNSGKFRQMTILQVKKTTVVCNDFRAGHILLHKEPAARKSLQTTVKNSHFDPNFFVLQSPVNQKPSEVKALGMSLSGLLYAGDDHGNVRFYFSYCDVFYGLKWT